MIQESVHVQFTFKGVTGRVSTEFTCCEEHSSYTYHVSWGDHFLSRGCRRHVEGCHFSDQDIMPEVLNAIDALRIAKELTS